MLPIADQTAGPNGLTFLWTLRGAWRLKNSIFFQTIFSIFFATGYAGSFSQYLNKRTKEFIKHNSKSI